MDQETVVRILDYDRETGVFIWREKISRKVKIGSVAGTIEYRGNRQYLRINIAGKPYYAHRLAWLYENGFMPKLIDHKDLNGLNNAIFNLRLASHSENHANESIRMNNTTGYKGVSFYKKYGKYSSEIRVLGRRVFLGYYSTPHEAHAAYVAAANKYYGEFARGA